MSTTSSHFPRMMIKRTEKEDKGMQGGGIYNTNKEEDEEQGEARLTHRSKRSIANSTSKTSYGPLVTWTSLLVVHLACMFSQGLEIEPVPMVLGDQDNPWKTPIHNFTYCLGSGEPLRLLEHRDFAELSNRSDFRRFVWWAENQTGGPLIQWELLKNKPPLVTFKDPTKYQQYQHWGLEILNVTKEDEEVYLAQIVMEDTYNESRSKVAILSPPKLSSGMLKFTREAVDDQSVKLTCGEVEYVGDPPITLELKAADGTVLDTSDTEGNLSFIMLRKDDRGDFVCEIDWDHSEAAASCLDEKERTAWKVMDPPIPTTRAPISATKPAPETPPPTTTTTTTTTPVYEYDEPNHDVTAAPEMASKADSSIMTYVLVGLVAAVVVALVGAGIKSMMKKKAPVQTAVAPKLEKFEVAPVEPVAPRAPLAVPEADFIYGTLV